MVRAAATGAIDYSCADPKDINWKLRHRLIIKEMERQENAHLFDVLHRHHLAYVSHGSLIEESYAAVRKRADEALTDIQRIVFPWFKVAETSDKPEDEKDTIKPETRALIEKYKQMQADASQTPQG
jgi:hypothetical protein